MKKDRLYDILETMKKKSVKSSFLILEPSQTIVHSFSSLFALPMPLVIPGKQLPDSCTFHLDSGYAFGCVLPSQYKFVRLCVVDSMVGRLVGKAVLSGMS